jgi:hypothetical protein
MTMRKFFVLLVLAAAGALFAQRRELKRYFKIRQM